MRILHLSDTPLSGSPIRISNLLAKHGGVESRHICWKEKIGYRVYDNDLVGHLSTLETMRYLIYEWADVLHLHNRWKRQEVFKALGTPPPAKPAVIQIHSPRDSEDFSEEVASGIPIACVAQYHPRQWPECKFIVPNVVDITDDDYKPGLGDGAVSGRAVVSYAPSNTNGRGWDDKSYGVVAPVLKRMRLSHEINYQLIQQTPFCDVMRLKKQAAIGVDEISTGSYHLSALEYLAIGVPCFAGVDEQTENVVKDLTGCLGTPFIRANKESFERKLRAILKDKSWAAMGIRSREWMDNYWNPKLLVEHYLKMYRSL